MNDLSAPPSATSPANRPASRDPLPDAWIGRVFDRLAALYGSKFADLWAGTDPERVRAVWAEKLAGFRDMPKAISKALDACDNRPTPPNLPEFLAMCREEGRRLPQQPSAPAIGYTATPEEVAEANKRIAEAAHAAANKAPAFDYVGWAKRPGSALAMRAVVECAERKDERFVAILAQHKADGICDESGRLLKRWDVASQGWVKA